MQRLSVDQAKDTQLRLLLDVACPSKLIGATANDQIQYFEVIRGSYRIDSKRRS